jgi:hypothetical protein
LSALGDEYILEMFGWTPGEKLITDDAKTTRISTDIRDLFVHLSCESVVKKPSGLFPVRRNDEGSALGLCANEKEAATVRSSCLFSAAKRPAEAS